MRERPRVVIIGAGFGGLTAARALSGSPVDVQLLDRNNYHTFLPLLYQVAAAELEPEDIAYPARSIVRSWRNVHFDMAYVNKVDLASRLVEANGLKIRYDYLVIAIGSVSQYFQIPGAAQYTFPLRTLTEGATLRSRILCCFERAEHEQDASRRERLLTFVIVGGGPTGVEFAGALAELIQGPLVKDYPLIDFRQVRLILLEATDSLLPGLPESLRTYTQGRLRRMGVDVRLEAAVIQVTPEAVCLKDGSIIPTETVIWTAGVRGDPLAQDWGLPLARSGRVAVLPTLQVPGHPEVFVIGDLAYLEENGRPLPMIAPVAIQEGEMAARNILRLIRDQDPLPFRYQDKGTMVTIGRNAAVAHVGGRNLTGFPAWIVWLSVHLFNLIGFRNRLVVLINWALDYLFYERAVRLILPIGAAPSDRERC